MSGGFAVSGGGYQGAPTMVQGGLLPPSSTAALHSPSQHIEEEILSDEEARKRRELLARRPSYRKIFNDLSDVERDLKTEPDAGAEGSESTTDSQPPEPQGHMAAYGVLPPGLSGLNGDNPLGLGLMGSGLLQYGQDHGSLLPVSGVNDGLGHRPVGTQSPMGGAYSPVHSSASSLKSMGDGDDSMGGHMGGGGGGGGGGGPSTQKRQMRLLKNREAAKECRRKKKEYVKCLENRVAVLENQNKALIEELKTLKELYCRKGD